MRILSTIALAFKTGICFYLATGHLRHWTRPREQKQIVRIILFVPLYSAVAFFSVWFYQLGDFLVPYGQLMEGMGVNAIFLLYLEIANPGARAQEDFYRNLPGLC